MNWTLMIKETAHEQGIDPYLYLAVCSHESSLDPLAIRFEPNFKWTQPNYRDFADHNRISPETELILESMSFGLCQIMGTVARDLGYKGPLQKLMTEPKLALTHGAVHLKSFLQRYGNETDAISAYNQGGRKPEDLKTDGGMYKNQVYVDAVSKILRDLRKVN